MCVCVTHPHIWSHLCWWYSLVDRCRHSYQRCWCILLHHTRREWCYIHRCLKHAVTSWIPQFIWSWNTSVDVQIFGFLIFFSFCWDAVARCSKSLLHWSKSFSLRENVGNQMALRPTKMESLHFWFILFWLKLSLISQTCKQQEQSHSKPYGCRCRPHLC